MIKQHKNHTLSRAVPDHAKIKPMLMSAIASMGVHSNINNDQRISNTDWHINQSIPRPYVTLCNPVIQDHMNAMQHHLGYEVPMGVHNIWFQQYGLGDHHKWHAHGMANYSSVYYVDLPDGAAKTSFLVDGEEYQVAVEEGDILTFPAMFLHCSKPNSAGAKTVIVFNSSWA